MQRGWRQPPSARSEIEISTVDLSGLAQPFKYGDRNRTQTVVAATVSGDSSDGFKLPAGAVGFAVGVENRKDKGDFYANPDLGQSFNQGVESFPPVPPFIKANELYAEVSVPLLAKLPGVKRLALEGAFRRSSYDKSVGSSNLDPVDSKGRYGSRCSSDAAMACRPR